jgi:hypothetical protein
MDNLLEKVRRLTLAERQSLAKKGIYLLSCPPEKDEMAQLLILNMFFTEDEQSQIKTYEDEQKVFDLVIKRTYGLEEKDAKNS